MRVIICWGFVLLLIWSISGSLAGDGGDIVLIEELVWLGELEVTSSIGDDIWFGEVLEVADTV
jgi:hypothetical protein